MTKMPCGSQSSAEMDALHYVEYKTRVRRGVALNDIIARLESPHAGKVYVAKDYTKADLIADLMGILK